MTWVDAYIFTGVFFAGLLVGLELGFRSAKRVVLMLVKRYNISPRETSP